MLCGDSHLYVYMPTNRIFYGGAEDFLYNLLITPTSSHNLFESKTCLVLFLFWIRKSHEVWFRTKMMIVSLALILVLNAFSSSEAAISEARPHSNRPGRFLSLPIAQKCANRPKEFNFRGHNYFLSKHVAAHENQKLDWLDARNVCREYCMDLVSLETQEENNHIFRLIQQNDVPYIWTSGRLCDFQGCENRPDLEPKAIYGWFWSANREKMAPTNQSPAGWTYNPWSQSGHKKIPQPDNAEFEINTTRESCLSVLNNVYNDGIAWHDVACYHAKPFVCEDSEELLNYIASTNRGIRL